MAAKRRVVVTGSAGVIGRRVCAALVESTDADVVGLDRDEPLWAVPGVDDKQVDLVRADVDALFEGADVVVHLASALRADALDPAEGVEDQLLFHRVLDAVDRAGVGQLVMMSSAMVYGAWADNPVPLTEDAPIRPNPDFAWAVHKTELERMATSWRRQLDRTGRPVVLTVLRPAITVAEESAGGLAAVFRSLNVLATDEGDAPSQFLHADDLAAAVIAVVDAGLDGVCNVAPDGWVSADDMASLAGPLPRVHLPLALVRGITAMRRRLGLSRTPPGLVDFTTYPWVVSNDLLRSTGWEPTHTSEEAYVASHAPMPLDELDPKRRQYLALGGAVAAVVALVAGLVGLVVWWRRRR